MTTMQTRIWIPLLSFVGLLICCLPGGDAEAEPLAYWRFESGGFYDDSSGNGHALTDTGFAYQSSIPADFLNPIPPGTGLTNGSAAYGLGFGLLSTPDDDVFTTNTMTIEALIQPDTISETTTGVVVSHFDSQADPPQRGWYLGIPTNRSLRLYLSNDGADINTSREILPGTIEAGKSYYIAGSYAVGEDIGPEGEDILWRIYLRNLTDNGPLYVYGTASDLTVPFTSINNVPGPLAIGSTSTLPDGTAPFMGTVDEVRISDTMLDMTDLLVYYPGIPIEYMTIISGTLAEPEFGGGIESIAINMGGEVTKYQFSDLAGGTLTAFGGQFGTGQADIIMPAGTTEAPAPEDRAGLLSDDRADTGFVNMTSWTVTFEEDITNREGPDILLLDWGSVDTVDITIGGTTLDDAGPFTSSFFNRSMPGCPRFLSDQTDVTTLAALLSATFTQGPNTGANNSAFEIDLTDFGFALGAVLTAGTEVIFSDGETIDPVGVFGLLDPAIGIPGDFDEDGDVDGADFLAWQMGFGGTYGASDLADWQTHFGAISPAIESMTAVPEPSSILLFLLLGGVACYRSSRQS